MAWGFQGLNRRADWLDALNLVKGARQIASYFNAGFEPSLTKDSALNLTPLDQATGTCESCGAWIDGLV
jgi:hypothetical protein